MVGWCIKHGVQVAVIALLIFVLGIVAAMRIPVQMIPDLDVRTISVVTSWPGATRTVCGAIASPGSAMICCVQQSTEETVLFS